MKKGLAIPFLGLRFINSVIAEFNLGTFGAIRYNHSNMRLIGTDKKRKNQNSDKNNSFQTT